MKKAEKKKVPVENFDYPKQINNFTALFRLELQPKTNKVFHYKIKEDTQKCVINLAYYISESTAPYDDVKLKASISLYSPENQVVNTIKIDGNQRTP